MSKQKCGLCGKDPAEGFASINDTFYCHGDDDPVTCYMKSQNRYLQRPTDAESQAEYSQILNYMELT